MNQDFCEDCEYMETLGKLDSTGVCAKNDERRIITVDDTCDDFQKRK